LVLCPYRLG